MLDSRSGWRLAEPISSTFSDNRGNLYGADFRLKPSTVCTPRHATLSSESTSRFS
eukprot:TRINITY_DN2361_c0_g1_i1.p6 TRINITY_DN2361_c0_g1~~TRINITY_DN2361_c0_g1_i1.p6  ORF type:complete len:55 (+),score=5.23 TRINITY_DN2361_c0_g1_i1:469-633(+)